MARPELGPWQKNGLAPVFAYWKRERRVVAMMSLAPNGYVLEKVITGTNPPMTFVNETEALIWLHVYLQRPDAYTKEDAISEILDRWGDQEWLIDIREFTDGGGMRLKVTVESDTFPADDPLPRRVGPKGEEIYFVVILVDKPSSRWDTVSK